MYVKKLGSLLLTIAALAAMLVSCNRADPQPPVSGSSSTTLTNDPFSNTTSLSGSNSTTGDSFKTTTGHSTVSTTTSHKGTTSSNGTTPTVPTGIPGCKHTYLIKKVPATCTEKGYTRHICQECGASFVDNETKALGHSYTTITIKPTQLTGGYDEHVCSRCNATYRDHFTDPVNPNYTSSGLTFVSNGDGTCRLTDMGTCSDIYISVPKKSPSGDIVTSVVGSTFAENKKIVEVRLPDTVTQITGGLFYGCSSLERVVMPKGLVTMGEGVFSSCYALKMVDFNGADITAIPKRTFDSCVALTMIDIPHSVTSIEEMAFYGCQKLTTVIYGSNMKTIGTKAFYSCSSLSVCRASSSAKNLDTLTSIQDQAFYSCALDEVAFSPNLTLLGTEAFRACGSMKVADLSKTGLKDLFPSCFAYTALENIHLPKSLENIGYNAFESCSRLYNIALPNSLKIIGDRAFKRCGFTALYLGSNLTTIGRDAFAESKGSLIWNGTPSIKTIGYRAFADYKGASVIIPDSVTAIERSALAGCTNLSSLQIPFIGSGAATSSASTECFGYLFGDSVNCWEQNNVIPSSLKKITLHGTEDISSRAFMLVNVNSFVLGTGVKRIAVSGFEGCSTLKNVYYEGTSTQWTHVENYSQEVKNATIWFYSENVPPAEGRYWHYDKSGDIVSW